MIVLLFLGPFFFFRFFIFFFRCFFFFFVFFFDFFFPVVLFRFFVFFRGAALGFGAVCPPRVLSCPPDAPAGPFARGRLRQTYGDVERPGCTVLSVARRVAEKFHSASALLKRLNPGAGFIAGKTFESTT